MSKRLRLVKILVQAVVMIDDGDELAEAQTPPFTVSPSAWPTFATTEFAAAFAEWQKEVESEA
jgi:hypothetical protein